MSCGGADGGTGPVLLCFVVDLFHLGIWGTACPFSALMMLWSLGMRDWIMAKHQLCDMGCWRLRSPEAVSLKGMSFRLKVQTCTLLR